MAPFGALALAALLALPGASSMPAPQAAAPAACGAGSSRVAVDAVAGGFWDLPPCTEVEFEAHDIEGRPPLAISWEADTGETFPGNPTTLDTTGFGGFHRLTVMVSNAYGTARRDVFFRVEPLAVPPPVALSQNPTPGLSVTVAGSPSGATEWAWLWGDGTASPWSSDCADLEASHTYPAPGSYAVRLRARSCSEGPLTSDPLTAVVGDSDAIEVLTWQVRGCEFGVCLFAAGETLTFDQSFSAVPDRIDYDWNGDGTTDETTTVAAPTATHAYPASGAFRPVVTAHRGSAHNSLQHQDFILIQGSQPELIFEDGFESGGVGCWSSAMGSLPDDDCNDQSRLRRP
jgi:PKD repeat protein